MNFEKKIEKIEEEMSDLKDQVQMMNLTYFKSDKKSLDSYSFGIEIPEKFYADQESLNDFYSAYAEIKNDFILKFNLLIFQKLMEKVVLFRGKTSKEKIRESLRNSDLEIEEIVELSKYAKSIRVGKSKVAIDFLQKINIDEYGNICAMFIAHYQDGKEFEIED